MNSNCPLTHHVERLTDELIYCRKQYAFLDTADCGEPIPNLMEDLTNLQDRIQYLSAGVSVLNEIIRIETE